MPPIVDRLQGDSQGVVAREVDLGGLKSCSSVWGNYPICISGGTSGFISEEPPSA